MGTPYDDSHALSLNESDSLSGSLRRDSFIRIGKLFTANETLIAGISGHLKSAKIAEAIAHLINITTNGVIRTRPGRQACAKPSRKPSPQQNSGHVASQAPGFMLPRELRQVFYANLPI